MRLMREAFKPLRRRKLIDRSVNGGALTMSRAAQVKGELTATPGSPCLDAATALEEKDDQQDDENQKKNTTTDVHLKPPFRSSRDFMYPLRSRNQPGPPGQRPYGCCFQRSSGRA